MPLSLPRGLSLRELVNLWMAIYCIGHFWLGIVFQLQTWQSGQVLQVIVC